MRESVQRFPSLRPFPPPSPPGVSLCSTVALGNLIGRAFAHDEEHGSCDAFNCGATARLTSVRILFWASGKSRPPEKVRTSNTVCLQPLWLLKVKSRISGRSASVPVMQPADFGYGNDAASVGGLYT